MRGEGHTDRIAVTAAVNCLYACRVLGVVNNLVRRNVVGSVGGECAQNVVQVEIVSKYARVRACCAVGAVNLDIVNVPVVDVIRVGSGSVETDLESRKVRH